MRGLSLAKKEAKKLRAKFASNKRVLDPILVAQSCNINIKEEIFIENISGILFKDNGNFVIAVNKKHPDTRKRFTIAHELGHFILHKENLHYDPKSQEGFEVFLRADGVISADETEANYFAAELLMPEDMVRKDFEKFPNISKLAEIYEVSEHAMSYRLTKLDLM